MCLPIEIKLAAILLIGTTIASKSKGTLESFIGFVVLFYLPNDQLLAQSKNL